METNVDKHLTCTKCEYSCAGKGQLTRHMKTHNLKRTMPTLKTQTLKRQIPTFKCNDCSSTFDTKRKLTNHEKREHEEKTNKAESPVRKKKKEGSPSKTKTDNSNIDAKEKETLKEKVSQLTIKLEEKEREIIEVKESNTLISTQLKEEKEQTKYLLKNREEWIDYANSCKVKYKEIELEVKAKQDKDKEETEETVMEIVSDMVESIVRNGDPVPEHEIPDLTVERYWCTTCDKTYQRECDFKAHMKMTHNYEKDDDRFCKKCFAHRSSCEKCINKSTSNCQDRLDQHIKQKHKMDTDTSENNLEKHNKENHGEHSEEIQEIYRCTPCEIIFKEEQDFRTHIKDTHVHEDEEFQCDKCEFISDSKKLLENHILKKHKEWNCEHCQFQGSDQCNLKKHKDEAKHNDLNFKCKDCDRKFFNFDQMMKHRKAAHRVKICRNLPNCTFGDDCHWTHPEKLVTESETEEAVRVEEVQENKWKCRTCEETFSSKNRLMNHRKQNHPETVRQCDRECYRADDQCWYSHKAKKEVKTQGAPNIYSQTDFPNTLPQHKPPDHNSQVMMKWLEMMSQMMEQMRSQMI